MAKLNNEFPTPHEVLESATFRELSLSAKVLYMFLCKLRNRPGRNGWFFRSEKQLAKDLGVNPRTIRRAKKELLASNFIQKERGSDRKHGWRGADHYYITAYLLPRGKSQEV